MTGTHQIEAAPSNAEQLRAWDGAEGAYWAAHAERFDRAMAGYDPALFGAAAIDHAARVLDIGCGGGQTTREAARHAAGGSALGIDLSSEMIELARRAARHAGIGNARFEQGDAQVHPFPDEAFDVAISRTGTMFFGEPVTAFTNVRRALRRGGRLVQLVWQPFTENEWVVEIFTALAAGRDLPVPPSGAPGPFSMADPDRVRALLSAAGLADIGIADVRAPMDFGPTPDQAHAFVSGLLAWMLEGLDGRRRDGALDALRATMAAHHTAEGVRFDSAAWLVTASRP